MNWKLRAIFSLTLASCSLATGNTPHSNPNGNWPATPFWFSGAGGGPQQPPQNTSGPPYPFGSYLPAQLQNNHTSAVPWPGQYAFPHFEQQPPFGYGPPPMFYGGFAQQALTTAPTMAGNASSTGERTMIPPGSATDLRDEEHVTTRAPAQPGSALAGPSRQNEHGQQRDPPRSRWRSPSPPRDAHRHRTDIGDDSRPQTKGKRRTTQRELDQQREEEDSLRREERARDVEHAHLRAERAPIPRDVLDIQAQELVDTTRVAPDSTTSALRDQLSMNAELMRRCDHLEKLLMKRQLSPEEDNGSSLKRHRESHPHPSSN